MSAQPEALRLADALWPWNEGVTNNLSLAAAELRRLHAENEALKQTLHDELDGNLRLREIGGARPDETMTAFLERVFAQRDALLEALKFVIRGVPDTWEGVQKARAAIAAVEGETK